MKVIIPAYQQGGRGGGRRRRRRRREEGDDGVDIEEISLYKTKRSKERKREIATISHHGK